MADGEVGGGDGSRADGGERGERGARRRVPPAMHLVAALLRPPLRVTLGRRWVGAHHLPREGGFIVVANHVSNLDPLLVGDFLLANGAPPSMLAKSELFTQPAVASLLRAAGQVEVRRDTDDARAALEAAREVLAQGRCIVIFPEGTFTRDPELWPMTARPGAARLALETGVPVVPVVCWGGQKVLAPFTSRFRPLPRVTAQVVAGRPMTRADLLGPGYDHEVPGGGTEGRVLARAATDRIMDRLTAMLAVVRGSAAPQRRWDLRTDTDPGPSRS